MRVVAPDGVVERLAVQGCVGARPALEVVDEPGCGAVGGATEGADDAGAAVDAGVEVLTAACQAVVDEAWALVGLLTCLMAFPFANMRSQSKQKKWS